MSISANLLHPVWSELVDYLSKKYLINCILLVAIVPVAPCLLPAVAASAASGAGYSYFLEAAVGAVLALIVTVDRLRSRIEISGYTIVLALLVLGLTTNLAALYAMNRWNPPLVDHRKIVERLLTLQMRIPRCEWTVPTRCE